MKKQYKLIGMIVIAMLMLSACSSAPNNSQMSGMMVTEQAAEDVAWSVEAPASFDGEFATESSMVAFGGGDYGGALPVSMPPTMTQSAISTDQIVYTADVQLISQEFAETMDALDDLIARYNGFIEYSTRENTFNGVRFSTTHIRIPAESFHLAMREVEGLAEVRLSTTNAENISAQYADVQGRLASLRTQEERILAFMAEAEKVEDLILLEQRLSEITFAIENLTATRNDMDSRLAFSTIRVFVSETEQVMIQATSSITDAGNVFVNSMRVLRNVAVGFVLLLVAVIPWLIVVAVVATPVVMSIRKKRRKKSNILPSTSVSEKPVLEDSQELKS